MSLSDNIAHRTALTGLTILTAVVGGGVVTGVYFFVQWLSSVLH